MWIHQLISTEEQLWRTCREPCCKRARACRAPKIGCSNERPRKPATAEQEARAKAEFYRALQDEVARRDAERERIAQPDPEAAASIRRQESSKIVNGKRRGTC